MQCEKCAEFREITLHLHELYMVCDLLENKRPVYRFHKNKLSETRSAETTNIAKWLKLASQLESVSLNAFQYEDSHFWCKPIGDELDSDAAHHSSIITPLTRFIFISNALEETYRFISEIYEERYKEILNLKPKQERKRTYSGQITWLMDMFESDFRKPRHYEHKVELYRKHLVEYERIFNGHFDVSLKDCNKLSYGLSLVRNIRNHIAHAVFPIVDNPEYSGESLSLEIRNLVIRTLLHSARIATLNIQMILSFSAYGFESPSYHYLCAEPELGKLYKKSISFEYLNNLHITQFFALNDGNQMNLIRSLEEDAF
ncbi:hypothetical protein [Vibrio diabolicus]|uniref:hypothetical protein n=1 Tax=Vibrio diabolicus TaxID=50719 RepID=UPI0037501574